MMAASKRCLKMRSASSLTLASGGSVEVVTFVVASMVRKKSSSSGGSSGFREVGIAEGAVGGSMQRRRRAMGYQADSSLLLREA